MDETFTLLPISLDAKTKALSATAPSSSALDNALNELNALHRSLLTLPAETHATPPSPLPCAPKRSAQIQKMRDLGNSTLRKTPQTTALALEAAKFYTYGIEMALGRPGWEPSGLVREETSILYANRAQAYMGARMWAEGAGDAETSVEMKRAGNGKAWWRRGKCLVEMGRWEDAMAWITEARKVEGEESEKGELGVLARDIERHFASRTASGT